MRLPTLPTLLRHLAHEGPSHIVTPSVTFEGRPVPAMCPGPNDRAQRITGLNIATGYAVCVSCRRQVPLQHEPTGWGGPVLAPHPALEREAVR